MDFGSNSVDMGSQIWSTPLHQEHMLDVTLFPQLRHVVFVNFGFNWNCGALRNLRMLIFRNDISLVPCPAEVDTLLDAVSACPRLECLELALERPARGSVLPHASIPSKGRVRRTPMLFLRAATVSKSLGGAFLARFELPVARNIDISTYMEKDIVKGQEVAILNAVSDIIEMSRDDIVSMEVSISTAGMAGMDRPRAEIWASTKSGIPLTGASDRNESAEGEIRLDITYDEMLDFEPQNLMDVVFGSRFQALETLACSCVLSLTSWIRIFSVTPNLIFFRLNSQFRYAPENILMALDPYSPNPFPNRYRTDSSPTKSSGSELLLPALKLFEVELMQTPDELRDNYNHGETDAAWIYYDAWHKESLTSQLMCLIEMRSRRGYALNHVYVDDYIGNLEYLEKIREGYKKLREELHPSAQEALDNGSTNLNNYCDWVYYEQM